MTSAADLGLVPPTEQRRTTAQSLGLVPPSPDLGAAKPTVDTAEPPDRAVEGREAARGTDADAFSAEASPFGGSSGTLQRVWDGMLGKDVSRMGRLGMGLADPVFGGAQIGARMMATPGQGVPEAGFAGAPEEPQETTQQRIKTVDTAAQQREESYQQREKAAGLTTELPANAGVVDRIKNHLSTEWARMLGQGTATAPLAAIPGAGATVPARLALGGVGGALGGATMPVTGQQGQTPNFLREKLKQAGYGAVGGVVGQGLGEAAVPAARMAVGLPARPPPGPPGPLAPAAQQQVQRQFQRAAPMTPAGVRGAPSIATQQANRVSGVESIVAEKPNLVFDRARGTVSGQLPETRAELSEAVDQTKNSLFQKWDRMTRDTESGINPETSTIDKHKQAWADAQRDIAEANQDLRSARTARTLAEAQQSRAGDNVYRLNVANAAEKAARLQVRKAEQAVASATRRAENVRADLRKPWVDLKPVASELTRFANQRALRITPGSGARAGREPDVGIIKYAKDEAAKYAEEEAAAPLDVQSAITRANDSLKAFYKTPNYESAAKAGVDALVANKLRQGLDDLISKVTGPGYQQLKLQYGALAAIEKDTTRAAVRALGDTPETRFVDSLTNVASAEQLLEGLATLRFDPIMRGLLARVGQKFSRYMNNPDRAVKLMFQQAERNQRIGRAGFVAPALSRAMSLEATDQERPKIGDRGPYGGRINAINTINRPMP